MPCLWWRFLQGWHLWNITLKPTRSPSAATGVIYNWSHTTLPVTPEQTGPRPTTHDLGVVDMGRGEEEEKRWRKYRRRGVASGDICVWNIGDGKHGQKISDGLKHIWNQVHDVLTKYSNRYAVCGRCESTPPSGCSNNMNMGRNIGHFTSNIHISQHFLMTGK